MRVINILTLCYSLYIHNFITHLACWKAKKVDQKENKNKKLSRGGKKWCSTFHSKIMWSGWWVVIITGGYLCARIFVSKASGEVLLFVVYHQVDGDTTNNWKLKYNTRIMSSYLFRAFLFLVLNVVYTFSSLGFNIFTQLSYTTISHHLKYE